EIKEGNEIKEGSAVQYEADFCRREELAERILEALSEHADRCPESRKDLAPFIDEDGKPPIPGGVHVFCAPLIPEFAMRRDVAFIYVA
ncbi:MAG: hypothetical protein LBQ90_03120, partial [Synergistaceae bacterium]|nr:hypothetical protein [Synergistaceae bacterium]